MRIGTPLLWELLGPLEGRLERDLVTNHKDLLSISNGNLPRLSFNSTCQAPSP